MATLSSLLLFLLATQPVAAKGSVEEQRDAVRKGAQQVLKELYSQEPGAQKAIDGAAGYGVFMNFGMKILFMGGGKGRGIVVNNQTGEEIFMKMIEAQAGLGLGVKKFNVVFVFANQDVLTEFVDSGWEFGGQVTAAAKTDEEGTAFARAVSVKPGVWMYQITDEGFAAELTGKGTKYYKDDELNQ